MNVTVVDHPVWCEQARCRAEAGGPHVGMGELIEAGRSKVTPYLSQQAGEPVSVMLSVGHRGTGLVVPLTPDAAGRLAERLVSLVEAGRAPGPSAGER